MVSRNRIGLGYRIGLGHNLLDRVWGISAILRGVKSVRWLYSCTLLLLVLRISKVLRLSEDASQRIPPSSENLAGSVKCGGLLHVFTC